jgi:transcriptional regulator with XRE-family HTH domain
MPDTFPARLRSRRSAAGLSQAALAERAGISKARVSHLEQDDYPYRPSKATVGSLAGALGCLPADLDPEYLVDSIPEGAVVLRPDPDFKGAFRAWRDSDRAVVGDGPIGPERIVELTARLTNQGRPLCFLP